MANKIEELKKKRDQINAQIKSLTAKEQVQKRKLETRRKIVIGGIVLKMLKEGEMPQERLTAILTKHLDEKDKILFQDIL